MAVELGRLGARYVGAQLEPHLERVQLMEVGRAAGEGGGRSEVCLADGTRGVKKGMDVQDVSRPAG